MSIQQLPPKICSEIISREKEIQCIDVREPYEYELGNIGFVNIPMGETPIISEQFDKEKQTISIREHRRYKQNVINVKN